MLGDRRLEITNKMEGVVNICYAVYLFASQMIVDRSANIANGRSRRRAVRLLLLFHEEDVFSRTSGRLWGKWA